MTNPTVQRVIGLAAVVAVFLTTGCAETMPPGTETSGMPDEGAVETYMVGDIEVRTDGNVSRDAAFRTDEIAFDLEPGEGIEYKYRLEEGDPMIYAWESSGPVRSEMHSEADDQPEGTAEFFDVIESSTEAHGVFDAPFPGIHGWYWLNLNEEEAITLTLRSSGYYSYAMAFREGVRRRYEPALVTETSTE